MISKQKSYINILKATSIFGGVQLFNIVLQLLRSKLIAIFLGPMGMGLIGLYNSTLSLVSGITGFSLTTSAVKDVASADATNDENKLLLITSVIRRLMVITGFLGVAFTCIFSQHLSRFAFGNNNYTSSFILLSVTLLFIQLNNSNNLFLQGFRRLNHLAKASFYGNFFSLLMTIPLIYYFQTNGIIPSIIFSSIALFYFSNIYAKRLKLKKKIVSLQLVIRECASMLKMGFLINLSNLLTIASSYFVRVYITKIGGIEEVGLYSAGFAIVNTYFGLLLNAMSTDYYPRLAAISEDNSECRNLINQQAEVALLILAPILLIFIFFIKPIILLLYSTDFVPAFNMIMWGSVGMFFKTITWAMGFLLLAKSSSKIYFISEFISNVILLSINILGYKYYGLDGIGISFVISYLISLIQVYILVNYNYAFRFEKDFVKIFVIHLLLTIICLIVINTLSGNLHFIFGCIIILTSLLYSLIKLNERINLLSQFKYLFKVK